MMNLTRYLLCGAAVALFTLPVPAQSGPLEAGGESPYLDDRSTATDVIHSLYNAINRGEYLRAWSYFRDEAQPDFETYAEGFADTESVRLSVGEEMAEGAAGTTYWTVPVAIETQHADGTTQVFAGCYTLAQPNPAIQATPPFSPITIREGALAAVDAPLEDAVPNAC